MTPTVSVVMPVYNSASFVERAVRSVLDQSFRDFELIIIDDSSTDGSLSVIRKVMDAHPQSDNARIRIVRRSQNLGYSAATKTGVALAQGIWIAFVDADDWAEPEMLQALLDAAVLHRAGIAVAGIRTIRVGTGAIRVRREWVPRGSVATGIESLRHLASGDIGSFQTNKLIAKDLWAGVESPANAYGDLAVMHRLFSRAERIAFVRRPLYNYSLHAGSVTGSLRPSLWDLTAIPAYVYPTLNEMFTPREARALRRKFAYRQVYKPLIHGAAADPGSSRLAKDLESWTRSQMLWTELLMLSVGGKADVVLSLALAKASPNLHKRIFTKLKERAS